MNDISEFKYHKKLVFRSHNFNMNSIFELCSQKYQGFLVCLQLEKRFYQSQLIQLTYEVMNQFLFSKKKIYQKQEQ